jgi:outer membrane protein assembly factor BamB
MTSPRPRWFWFQRVGLPLLILGFFGTVYAATEWVPGSEENGYVRGATFTLALLLSSTFLALWVVFFAGLRRGVGVVIVLVLSGAYLAGIRTTFTGDMYPLAQWRWAAEHAGVGSAAFSTADLARRPKAEVDIPTDMPEFRGLRRTGFVAVPRFNRDWKAHPPMIRWEQPCGGGYAAFATANGFLVTIEQRQQQEVVVCYRADTGAEVWRFAYDALFSEALGGPGPRATPTLAGGQVFALGASGRLVCLDGQAGTPIWQVPILDPANKNISWGMSGSPLVVDDLVIVNPGAQTAAARGRGVIAYDRKTGTERWASGNSQASYASPTLAKLAGVRQVLIFDGDGLGGYRLTDGEELWRFPWRTQYDQGINVAQPLVVSDDRVFIASGYDRHAAVVQVRYADDEWSAELFVETGPRTMRAKMSSPVILGAYAYGLNEGYLECIEWATGKVQWKDERRPRRATGGYGHGQMLVLVDTTQPADAPERHTLLILSEMGEVVLVDADPHQLRERGRLMVLTGDKTWNTPAVLDGRLYIRNASRMACVELQTP